MIPKSMLFLLDFIASHADAAFKEFVILVAGKICAQITIIQVEEGKCHKKDANTNILLAESRKFLCT